MTKHMLFGRTIWEPNDLSGCLLWLDAGKITGKANLDTISQWNDYSGNSNHCTQSTEGNKPLYSATGIDGRPEVALTYKDLATNPLRWMTIPNGVSLDQQNATLICIGRPIDKQLLQDYSVTINIGSFKLGWGGLYTTAVADGLLEANNLRTYFQPHLTGVSSSPTGLKIWNNNQSQSFAAQTSVVRTGGKIGIDYAGNQYPAYGAVNEFLVYNRALTDNEMLQINTYAKNKYYNDAPTKQVIFDGDSLSTGYACLNHSNFPGQTWGLLGKDWKIYCVPVAGQTLQNMQSDAATEIDPLYSAGLTKNILVCWEGLLDVYYGADVPTTMTRMQTYCAARRAAGWKVVVLTCLPSNYISEANRTLLNAGIRDNWTNWADAISDIAADSRIGGAESNHDTTYFNNSDGNLTHMTQAGFAILAQITSNVIKTL